MTPEQRLAKLEAGENPLFLARMESGFAVMAEIQYLPGYCLLLASPQVNQLNDLPDEARLRFLSDLCRLGDAVMEATRCKRVNYGIYGNADPFLHAHVWPRFDWEELDLSKMPPLSFPHSLRNEPARAFSPEAHGDLIQRIKRALDPR